VKKAIFNTKNGLSVGGKYNLNEMGWSIKY